MEEKKLYPMSFCGIADEYDWGTDEFLLADLGYRDSLVRDGWLAGNSISEVMDTYLDRVVGDNAFSFWGLQFPLQVKRITVRGTMPLRVHPDALTALQRYDALGRRKLWYVLSAAPGARILAGWNKDTDASEVYTACSSESVAGMLKSFEPKAGDFIHIPSGTPHAATGSLELLEVSESSALDFCLSGLGQDIHPDEFDQSLSLVDALDFIDYKEFKGGLEHGAAKIANFEEFVVERLDLSAPVRVSGEADTFALYYCVKGSAAIRIDVLGQTASFALKPGIPVLVPAECPDFSVAPLEKDTVLLQITVPFQTEKDSYLVS
ncbi:MAG: hypothetical protein IK031_03155 [Bacteroidales bacterium]|nr:hypothetical protein [Bacteroidales bacterium]